MPFRSFNERKNLDGIDVTQISAIGVLTPAEMQRHGYAKKTGLVFYGAGENVQMYGKVEAVLKKLRAQGVDLINFPEHNYFVNPHKVSYMRQLRADSVSGMCNVAIGVQGIRHELDSSMMPAQAEAFQQALLKTGKPLFVRETKDFNDPSPVNIQTATGVLTLKQTQYPWKFPAQMLVIDLAQAGLIRSTERTLCIAFNDCSCLTLENGVTHPVPGLRESFKAMYPDEDSETILWRMKDFYKQKSLESLRGLADYGFWMDFKTPAERDTALQILKPQSG